MSAEPTINYHYIDGLVDADPLALRDLAVRLLVERDAALARAVPDGYRVVPCENVWKRLDAHPIACSCSGRGFYIAADPQEAPDA